MQPTTELVTHAPELWQSFTKLAANTKGSASGFHANGTWLTCPERARLKSAGVQRRPYRDVDDDFEISALDFGTLIHELLRIRAYYGSHDLALAQLDAWKSEIGPRSHMRAALQIGIYNESYPLGLDPVRYHGIECEVVTDIRMEWPNGAPTRPCFRSVRYDAVVALPGAAPTSPLQLYSLERKTAARKGGTTAHYGQVMAQVALWNFNGALVQRYGRMMGVIIEQHIKTKNPSCDRTILYVSPRQQRMAIEYLRYSENGTVEFKMSPDGTFPRMLHACWGKFSPCDYISLCHEGVAGDYTINGEEFKLGDDRPNPPF